MAGLPRSIIKKYGVTKKAWSVFRNSKKKKKRNKSTSIKLKRRQKTMPRRRYRTKRVRRSKRSGTLQKILLTILSAGAYGAVRAKISNVIAPVTDKIPLGNIADETGMIITAIMAKKFIGNKVPLIKKAADAGIVIESARIGEAVLAGGFLNNSSSMGSGLTPTLG